MRDLLGSGRDIRTSINFGFICMVPYNGVPNAPTIGSLGCVITPDTDDMALVWRVAPGANRKLLSAALGLTNNYRTLQTERPSEAHGRCEALRLRVDDSKIWVYYRLSPLIPILRSRELKQGGCDIKLPPSDHGA